MTVPAGRGGGSRRAAMARARQSRRPSRLGTAAGDAAQPDRVPAPDAGFPRLLAQAWRQAAAAPDLSTAVNALLTLGGHVPAQVQLRALRGTDELALQALCGVSWRGAEPPSAPVTVAAGEPPAFLGELGLSTSGRVVLRVPSQGPLASEVTLVDGVLRVPWSVEALEHYQRQLRAAVARQSWQLADCRQWLLGMGLRGREEVLELLREAALRTAPFVLYQEGKQYTNFRDRNTIVGKTLWPGHPDCALSNLQELPLELWSDNDVLMVVCLTLLVRSAGFARVEEANGTQLTIDHVAHLLERTRCQYNRATGGPEVPAAASSRVADLDELAAGLRQRRQQIGGDLQLYREIHGALMHKIERVAGAAGAGAVRREQQLCARLREQLPLGGATLQELGTDLAAAPDWLARPHGGFATGLESLIYQTVSAATAVFEADFAMSRGMRSLPELIRALGEQRWAEITAWDLPQFFCCVVPAPQARRHFDDSPARLADIAWSYSSRMQYNSWHFIAGNLPKVPAVLARDYFAPPTIPDLAYFSDQHHHGHVAGRVRFSIRSPQPVQVMGRTFNGFVDVRLLRCEGQPFDEQDLLAAHRSSAFIARATSLAADLVVGGHDIEVTAFDSHWHWTTIAGEPSQVCQEAAVRVP